jgi:hypothetical protein
VRFGGESLSCRPFFAAAVEAPRGGGLPEPSLHFLAAVEAPRSGELTFGQAEPSRSIVAECPNSSPQSHKRAACVAQAVRPVQVCAIVSNAHAAFTDRESALVFCSQWGLA